jgi:HAD superfamily hydrolase (TIGR01509 family)
MAPLHALLIDLDGVLRLWPDQDGPEFTRRFGLAPSGLREVAFAPRLLLPAITGEISDASWRAQIVLELARRFPDADGAGAVAWWSDSPGEVDPEVARLIGRCRRRCPVVLVTNGTSRLSQDLERLGLTTLFDRVISSSAVGAAKPDAAIFLAALAAAGVRAEHALFVDDTPGHVEAARHLGMVGHRYANVVYLQAVLEQHALCFAGSGGPYPTRHTADPPFERVIDSWRSTALWLALARAG